MPVRMACLTMLVLCFFGSHAQRTAADEDAVVTLNQQADGYRGIWYYESAARETSTSTSTAAVWGRTAPRHRPFAVYRPEVNKTFFCYGGTTAMTTGTLLHMVSYFDHDTGMVPRPTILLDKQTDDAHDNPVMSIDAEGYIWIFSTSHGTGRPSFIHRSAEPYDVSRFERVPATHQQGDMRVPVDNFSYMQVWHVPDRGFTCFFTRYGDPAARTSMFMTSPDGVAWSALAATGRDRGRSLPDQRGRPGSSRIRVQLPPEGQRTELADQPLLHGDTRRRTDLAERGGPSAGYSAHCGSKRCTDTRLSCRKVSTSI